MKTDNYLKIYLFSAWQDSEPDDTACLKAAYADDDIPSSLTGAVTSLSTTATLSGPLITSNSTSAAHQRQKKRTLDSVVQNLHSNKKKFNSEDGENLRNPSPSSCDYYTAKNVNNNNVTIDTSFGAQLDKLHRKKGPFGKKRLTEIVDANANNQLSLSDSLHDMAGNLSVIGSPLTGDDATCHICNKVLSTKASYKRHMNFHQGIYPHRCHVCGKGFAVKGDLRGHEATHTNEKEFPCLCCERVFAYKKNLQMHMRKKHQMRQDVLTGPLMPEGITHQ